MDDVGDTLVCGPNWLGDGVMSLPAIQAFKRRHPGARLTLLVKPALAPLWAMHGDVGAVWELGRGLAGVWRAAARVRPASFQRAYVMPNSFRSAVIPFLAGIPERVGARGHQRSWMLTGVVAWNDVEAHQSREVARLMGVEEGWVETEEPRLTAPGWALAKAEEILGGHRGSWVALIPGAARGPAKRWPVEHFGEVGRRLEETRGVRVLILGTDAERDLCGRLKTLVGGRAVDLAGGTSLPELVALLGRCRLALTNDSGGMHLATAAGTRVIAIFGLTDPRKTGPLGAGHRVIRREGVAAARDIRRDSREAEACLRSIEPERVFQAAMDVLRDASKGMEYGGYA